MRRWSPRQPGLLNIRPKVGNRYSSPSTIPTEIATSRAAVAMPKRTAASSRSGASRLRITRIVIVSSLAVILVTGARARSGRGGRTARPDAPRGADDRDGDGGQHG